MTATLRLAALTIAGVGLLPTLGLAQTGHGLGHRLFHSQPTPTQIANHLYGYYAGNHKHGGYGYGGGAGYGYSGGRGGTYNGGFFFPGYGNTYGFYPYGSGYNFSPPNYDPPAAFTAREPLQLLDPATGLPIEAAPNQGR